MEVGKAVGGSFAIGDVDLHFFVKGFLNEDHHGVNSKNRAKKKRPHELKKSLIGRVRIRRKEQLWSIVIYFLFGDG